MKKIYSKLLKIYGKQGWWPLLAIKGKNPTKTGSIKGYHPGDYSYPHNDRQKFEICIGAILTQNTSWINVEKALIGLNENKLIDAKKILKIKDEKLKEIIKPAGYYNQKCTYLKEFANFFLKLNNTPSREELLEVKGIGKETADSILLYAYQIPNFIVDAYTRRLMISEEMIKGKEDYDFIKKMIEDLIEKDYKIYQEFHALIVECGKQTKNECFLKNTD